jgi:uncharacterized MAPEG superfamily protein
MGTFSSTDIEFLWLSIVLGLGQLLLATLFSVGTRGLPWGVGPRDEAAPPLGHFGGRAERAYKNFLETFPFFLGAVAIATTMGKTNAMTALGCELYFWARLAYLPAYLFAIPFVRTLLWGTAGVGIALVLIYGVWPAA